MKMNKLHLPAFLFLSCGLLLIQISCKKQEQKYDQSSLKVSFPALKLKHDLYYSVSYLDRLIEMEFSETLEESTVAGNILFSDNSGMLDNNVDLQISGRKVLLLFHSDFELRDGWQYFVTIRSALKSTGGKHLLMTKNVELRTTAQHPDIQDPGKDSTKRISVAVISDIHMGLAKANTMRYCWFGQNDTALLYLLDLIYSGTQVKQVVILGDLFDEWIVPYTISPFDPSNGITDNKSYFQKVAINPINKLVVDKLKNIAQHQEIELIYVPGNHDMLLTNDILQGIIPGITWKGDTTGLGKYLPVPEIVLEHGHRYDFFNCPQPLVNPGHILPPGYFISRLYAQGTMEHPGVLKSGEGVSGSVEFLAAWDLAYNYTLYNSGMTWPDPKETNILMGGINNYPGPLSFDGVKEMYAANIEDNWNQTQINNLVPYPLACCFHAIWNGHSDLYTAAKMEYLDASTAPKTFSIVGFGHTHEAMLEVYPKGPIYSGIYANSGTWIDKSQTKNDVRTYLIITPGAWSGSAIDVVSLYQYNAEGSGGGGYEPKLLAEESI